MPLDSFVFRDNQLSYPFSRFDFVRLAPAVEDNDAQFSPSLKLDKPTPLMVKVEVLLDRNAISPGQIDGKQGDNARKAIAVFQESHGLDATGKLDEATWNELAQRANEPAIVEYILDLVQATRDNPELRLGVSPRGGLALAEAAQATAMLAARDYVIPDDVKDMFIAVCSHRVLGKSYVHNGDAHGTEAILRSILGQVAVPR